MKTIFGVIVAGGVGRRMGNVEKPKQFMELGGKPIIAHTIEKFVIQPEFEHVIVLVPRQWINHTKDIVKKYVPPMKEVSVIEGGDTRNQTIMNAIDYIEQTFGLCDDTVIITHDAVRPFVSSRILSENVEAAIKYGACDTAIPATDTIARSEDNDFLSEIPDRSKMYQGQTPQSFNAKKLKEIYNDLTEEEKNILTDACKIMVLRGEPVKIIDGEVWNIKITYPNDLLIAESLLGGNK